jgi:hypothetical protein
MSAKRSTLERGPNIDEVRDGSALGKKKSPVAERRKKECRGARGIVPEAYA